jgi:hypothetical protein
MDLDPDFNNHFLLQLFNCKDKLNVTLSEMLENIFNIYDYNGDGVLDKEEYITFISDILYISVLMNRTAESDYTIDTVVKVSNWSSSNFKTNLFRIPNERIHHDNFLNGILGALTETKESTIFPNSVMHTNSFVPELMHYFDYYVQLANRRGWPTELIEDASGNVAETKEEEPVTDPSYSIIDTSNNVITLNPTQQLEEYRERQRQRIQDKKDKEEAERQTVIRERHQQEDLVQQERHAHQQRLAAEYQERQRQMQIQETQEQQRQMQLRILQQQLQQIQRLQLQFREHLRQKHLQEQQRQQQEQGEEGQAEGEGQGQEPEPLPSAGPLDIDAAAEGFDVIDGNVNVVNYIEEDKADHVAFRIGDTYYLGSRQQIRSMINQGEKGNSLFYGCLCEIEDNWTLPTTWALLEHTVITNTIYFNIQQLGLPIRYLTLKDVVKVLDGPGNYFLIEKPKDEMFFPSFASDDILNHGIGSMSGAHCQEGQMDIVYAIRRYE